ncbi:hypothetical protein RhiirA1_475863 [Rhizophagus irregularis]|uniref:Serine-threonine/tyrosine-protein kinase catalytic domain-containing protein n=1 Tax=Rhizophagus irregularis TaxID=588596 RepID=A0A2N0QW55_9GLOM|nr:hypothetical protein RhiirA1_475863 [Rhizophagus irregularis]
MVLKYCENGNLRNYYLNNELDYSSKIENIIRIASGLLDNHNARKIHKDFHSAENRPTAKELYQILFKLDNYEYDDCDAESQVNDDSDTKSQTLLKQHYVNSECFDCQLEELDLDDINQDEENKY